MEHTHPAPNQHPLPDWQVLGELELKVDSSFEPAIDDWLTKILGQIPVKLEYKNRVIKSAHDAAKRAMLVDSVIKHRHIHFLVFAPINLAPQGRSWGFYRIERIEGYAADENVPDHAIEFYLYLEG